MFRSLYGTPLTSLWWNGRHKGSIDGTDKGMARRGCHQLSVRHGAGLRPYGGRMCATGKRDFNDITLTAVIPFRDQCGMWNFKDRQRYHAVLRQADFRILLSERYYKGCLLVRNDFMLSYASRIVACYDGRRRGGTFYTCNRARAMNIPVINLYDRLEE